MAVYKSFARFYDYLMADVPYDAWADRLTERIRHYAPQTKTVIDLACGTGNITSRLYKRGFQVMGIDVSEEMLMIAQDKAYESNQRIQYLCQDMTRFEIHKQVDAITCICDGLNYILKPELVENVFKRAAKHLHPQGLFLIDISSIYKLSTVLGQKTIAELDESVSFIWENHYDDISNTLEFDIAFFVPSNQGKGLFERVIEHHVQKGYSPEELSTLASPWFDVVEFCDGETLEPMTERSERLMMLFRKK